MRCAALQFDVRTDEPEANLAAASALLVEAAGRGVQLALLPELWPCSFVPDPGAALLEASERCLQEVRRLSRELGIAFAGSSHAGPLAGGALPANRFELFADGERLAFHDKVHLFSPTAEPLGFRAGSLPPPVVELGGLRVAGLVCYDLRFPELCRAPIRARAELLLVSAQWPSPRASHWRALVIGRAVEGQCYVVACNRSGSATIGRRRLQLDFPGNSLIVSPDGEVLAEGAGQAGVVLADLDPARVRELRRQVPVLEDERRELHAGWSERQRPE